jgi:hypothetical protein
MQFEREFIENGNQSIQTDLSGPARDDGLGL